MRGKTYPKGSVPTNDVPEVLQESLVRCSSFSGLEVPLVSLNGSAFSAIGLQEGEKEVRSVIWDVPKIQDGFAGPGISLMVEGFLCFRRKVYTKTVTQAANAPS